LDLCIVGLSVANEEISAVVKKTVNVPPPIVPPIDPSDIPVSKVNTQRQLATITEPLFTSRRNSFDNTESLNSIEKKHHKINKYLEINLGEAEYNYYMNFLKSLSQPQKDALAMPSNSRRRRDIELIKEVFEEIKPIDQPLYVYRCYKHGVTFQDLLDQPNNEVLSSATLSFKYANSF
jgi:hypothetical protein